MKQLKKHILFFDFLENHYASNDEVSKQHLNVIRKSNFVKTSDKAISHPPLEKVLINHQDQKTEIKAISLHVIGQQPDHIENTVSIKNSASEKSVLIEKPFLDLSSQEEKVLLKTSPPNMLEVVEKMLSDLKIKIEGTSRSTPCTISKNEKEIISDKQTDSDTVLAKEILNDELPEIKRFVENPKPMSFTQNWYSRSIPPDIQFQERVFQQFSVSIDKLYKWNIAGLSEQKIISHMSEVGIAHQNNHDIDQPDITDLLDFSSTLHEWRDLYPTGLPIFTKHIGCGTLNTPIYTISKYFVNLSSNISPRISGLTNILRCSTMIDYKWYQDVFVSRVMLQKDCHKPCWKGRFIDGQPPIFAHKVKQVLISTNDSLNYDNLTYDNNIFNIYIYIYIHIYIYKSKPSLVHIFIYVI